MSDNQKEKSFPGDETEYLLSSAANARHLSESIAQAESTQMAENFKKIFDCPTCGELSGRIGESDHAICQACLTSFSIDDYTSYGILYKKTVKQSSDKVDS